MCCSAKKLFLLYSVYCKFTIVHRVTSYTIKLAFTLFSRIFTGEGTIGYMDCNSTEHRGRERAATLISIL